MVYESSVVTYEGTSYSLIELDGEKHLLIEGDSANFEGEVSGDKFICPCTPQNAAQLRARLPWLSPKPLGLKVSAGFGDRLGVATVGHIAAVQNTGVAPIFAQQSVRENTRTGRTPQIVLDDAMWGVFEGGWREPWGADADHMKTIADIQPFVDAGYTFYTIDPSEFVDDDADTDELDTLVGKMGNLDWQTLNTNLEGLKGHYLGTFEVDHLALTFGEATLFKAAVKYGNAIAHTVKMARYLSERLEDFDLEVSVDETGTTTTLEEHFYIASELHRLGVKWVSLAPRFVGRFEKGVDYIGDLAELEINIAGHAAIMRHFGNSYKLSLHTGSDKFGVYPISMQHTKGLVHLKTAGTSYLEALRVMSTCEPALFRQVLEFARGRYENDRKTYHVSAELSKVPTVLTDDELPDLLNQFDARQVLHVTFGSVLDQFGAELQAMLRAHADEYKAALKTHFDKHLVAFKAGEHV